jgi:hypothetical protein
MPWLLNEDAAMKYHLQGLTCTDPAARKDTTKFPGGLRQVKVRYRLPEDEIAALDFPIIVIDPPTPVPAPDREHRSDGYFLQYNPEGYQGHQPGTLHTADYPIPYYLDYQVTLLCRMATEHFYPLQAALLQQDRLPYRFGYLEVPQDQTIRNMTMLGVDTGTVTVGSKDDNNKRLFRATFLARVFTELVGPITDYLQYPRVSDVTVDLSIYQSLTDISYAELTESFGIIGSRAGVGWNTN